MKASSSTLRSTRLSGRRLSGLAFVCVALLGIVWTSCSSKPEADDGSAGGSPTVGGADAGGAGSVPGGGGLVGASGGNEAGGSAAKETGGATSTATGGGSSGGASSGGSGGVSACAAEPLDPPAQPAQPRVDLQGPAPVPEGGVIGEGVYDQVDYVFYQQVDVSRLVPARQAMRFRSAGEIVDIAREDSMGQKLDVTMGVRTEGTRLTLTATCPDALAGAKEESGYSSTSRDLWIFLDQLGGTAVIHYSKR